LWDNWVGGNGGGHTVPTRPPGVLAAFLWAILRGVSDRFPLLERVARGARPVPFIIAASLTLFFLAPLLLFHLYLPYRYTSAVARVLLILLGGGVLLALVDGTLGWATNSATQRGFRQSLIAVGCAVLLGVILSYPLLLPAFPTADYIRGADPGLYHFVAQQP